ncbi:hypothetical protein CEXT_486391 [Caerostris extrusa]|uniref:Uncharacterized protein n=1 Tax=Caerostris extrusa TaxID=172846 RepID=A0AAV4RGR1_CAEEX|nr:hypothetical protein CEXT_486391 [Caerostris extrusa]
MQRMGTLIRKPGCSSIGGDMKGEDESGRQKSSYPHINLPQRMLCFPFNCFVVLFHLIASNIVVKISKFILISHASPAALQLLIECCMFVFRTTRSQMPSWKRRPTSPRMASPLIPWPGLSQAKPERAQARHQQQ